MQQFQSKLLSVASEEHKVKKELSLTPIKSDVSKKSNRRIILKSLKGDIINKKNNYYFSDNNPFKSVYALDYQMRNQSIDSLDALKEQ